MTLGEWLARDNLAGRIEPGEARDAAIAPLHQAVVQGLAVGREVQSARVAAGEKPDACLPPPGAVQLSTQEIGIWLHNRPAAEHGETMTEVMSRFLAARFACS
jgi:hypothetical protein